MQWHAGNKRAIMKRRTRESQYLARGSVRRQCEVRCRRNAAGWRRVCRRRQEVAHHSRCRRGREMRLDARRKRQQKNCLICLVCLAEHTRFKQKFKNPCTHTHMYTFTCTRTRTRTRRPCTTTQFHDIFSSFVQNDHTPSSSHRRGH